MPDVDPNLPADPSQEPGQPQGRYFSQEDVEALLAKEREKLTGRISKDDERFKTLQSEVADLRKVARAAEKAEADRQAAIEASKKKAEEAELSAKELIERRQAEFEAQRQADLAAQNNQLALMAKELEFTKIQAHTQRRINEESDNIAPELLQFVTGNTIEEIEASIERVKATTASIVENMKAAGIRQRAAMPGVAPSAGTNATGPLDAPGERQYSDQDIKDMGMAEYAALRQRMGLGGANNQGLFRA